MIIKGTSRAGPGQLARHLQRTDTNERVEILELVSPLDSLYETFLDWQVLSEGTRGSKGLYHANIDPDRAYTMTPEQWRRAVSVLEEELGFQGQPRAVVLHEKHGRAHIHVVWQRTNVDTMTLVSDSWNYRAHERASLRLEREFGHEIVPGKHDKRDRESQPEFPRAEFGHADWQQAERAGLQPCERKEAVTALHAHSDTGQAFKNALEAEGYVLAKGDRRDFVLVDADAEVHSLSRLVKGATAKELRAFMADIDRASLPTVEAARELQRNRPAQAMRDGGDEEKEEGRATGERHRRPAPEPSKANTQEDALAREQAIRQALEARAADEEAYIRRRQEYERDRIADAYDADIRDQLGHLAAQHEAERAQWKEERQPGNAARVMERLQRRWNPEGAAARSAERKKEWQALIYRQKREAAEYKALREREKESELAAFRSRHDDELRAHRAQAAKDVERHLREQEAAARLLQEVEAQRQRKEAERARAGFGPELPPPRRAR